VRLADHSSRGVLPTVVRRCVGSRNLVNEETLARWGGEEGEGSVAPNQRKENLKISHGDHASNCRVTVKVPRVVFYHVCRLF